MKNILCKLGFHDWYKEDYERKQNIEQEILGYPISISYYVVCYKICLRCESIEDNITEYKEFCRKEKTKENLRSKKANDIIMRKRK